MTSAYIEPRAEDMSVNGVRLRYLDWGEEGKPPMVLLHGFSAHAHYWDGFAAKMRGDYHVYALDQRGHGDSDWADDYGPDTMPADLEAFVDRLGLGRFTLVGHSMGGGVAFRYAAGQFELGNRTGSPTPSERGLRPRDPHERLERLIIVDSALPSPDRPPVAGRENSVTRSLAQEFYDNEDAAVAHFQRLNPRAPEDRVRMAVRQSFRALPDGRYTYKFDPKLRNRLSAGGNADDFRKQANELRGKLAGLTCPVLIVRGGNSDILSPEAAADTVSALPNATLVTVPNTGHNVPTDDARGFRGAVRDWLGLPPV